jgi:squalene-hopene/tetraprenyl-beta-curcumene cyclase
MAQSAARWLARAQNPDGGWGGQPGVASSIEETALAVEALAAATRSLVPVPSARTLEQGVACLVQLVESGAWRQPTPIGFYFARLWYFEKLYPLIFTTAALSQLVK